MKTKLDNDKDASATMEGLSTAMYNLKCLTVIGKQEVEIESLKKEIAVMRQAFNDVCLMAKNRSGESTEADFERDFYAEIKAMLMEREADK